MPSAPGPAPLLAVDDLSYTYGATRALDGVSLRVEAGEIVALTGRNGAGKSTLMRCIASWLRPTSGAVRILGTSAEGSERLVRRRAVLVPDTPSFWDDLTAWEHLRFVAGLARLGPWEARAQALLDRLGLGGRGEALPATYSRGMRYKLALAMALLARPPLLLLDEPFGPLDAESALVLWAMLREHAADPGRGILLSCHHLPAGAEPTRFVVLADGRIAAQGGPGLRPPPAGPAAADGPDGRGPRGDGPGA